MPESRRRFTWKLTFDGDHLMPHEVFPDVERVMGFWVNNPKYPGKFLDLEIGGIYFGFLQVGMTIVGRDQWRCRERAGWIARALMSAAHVKYAEVVEPKQERLPPHEHRGARRFEAPKYGGPACEARSSSRASTVSL